MLDALASSLRRSTVLIAGWISIALMAGPAAAAPENPTPKPDKAAKAVPDKVVAPDKAAAPQKQPVKVEAPKKDAAKQEAPKQDAAKNDAPKQDAPKKDAAKKDTVPQQAAKKDAKPAKAAPVGPDLSRDPDFVLQGEFAGQMPGDGEKMERVALQIRPLGHGRFEALQFRGGLPGEPAHQRGATRLIGQRFEQFLVLSGGPWAVFVEPKQCILFDRNGQRVGSFERVLRKSPTLGARPPKEAVVLFNGKETPGLVGARVTPDGLLMEGAELRQLFQDFNLHLEFMLPFLPAARDQGRGNSGIYLLSRYEVQILDSFAQQPLFNGCGSLYRFRRPDVNACLPPMVWQTYDVAFTAPRWASDGTKLKNARVCVWLNGIKVQNNVELPSTTGAGKPEEPLLLPIRFQDHRNPVRFRNIWLVDRGALAPVDFPPQPKPAAKPKAAPGPAKPAPEKATPEQPKPLSP